MSLAGKPSIPEIWMGDVFHPAAYLITFVKFITTD